jgi:hypothetical protein
MAHARLARRERGFCVYPCMQFDVLFLVYPVAVGAVSGLVYTGNQTLCVTQSTHAESMDGRKRGTNHAESNRQNRMGHGGCAALDPESDG